MKEATIFNFVEHETKDEGFVSVKSDDNAVTIVISLRNDGDIQVTLSKADIKRLNEILANSLTS